MLRRDLLKIGVLAIGILALLPLYKFANLVEQCPQIKYVNESDKSVEAPELSLVFYYVPWNYDSVTARKVFDDVARRYEDEQIYFATVNCWHLACNCSRAELKGSPSGEIRIWPRLVVTYGRKITLEYQGAWTLNGIDHFIRLLLKPIERIHSKEDLKALALRTDGVVLGCFDNPQSIEYRRFASAAIKWLQTDPEQGFRFATALGKVGDNILPGISSKMPAIVMINGDTFDLFEGQWSARQIIAWLHQQLHKIKTNYAYNAPESIAQYLKSDQAVMAIFINDVPFADSFYKMIDDELGEHSIVREKKRICSHYRNKRQKWREEMSWAKDQDPKRCRVRGAINGRWLQNYYSSDRQLEEAFRSHQTFNSYKEDVYGTDKLLAWHERWHCRDSLSPDGNLIQFKVIVGRLIRRRVDELWLEYAPYQNRSLEILILDHGKYADYLERLGIGQRPEQTAAIAVIIDPLDENVYVMPQRFSSSALLAFVQNYMQGNALAAAAIHKATAASSDRLTSEPAADVIHRPDANRLDVMQLIRNQNTTVVLEIYSPQCAFSAIMSQTLTQVMAVLQLNSPAITFLRLDSQSNELPWEFVMPTAPTLLVFPQGDAMESRRFPSHLNVNVANVLGFILSQIETPVDQVKLLLGYCRNLRNAERIKKCLLFAQNFIGQRIGEQLKIWQMFEQERKTILMHLEQMKNFHLDL